MGKERERGSSGREICGGFLIRARGGGAEVEAEKGNTSDNEGMGHSSDFFIVLKFLPIFIFLTSKLV